MVLRMIKILQMVIVLRMGLADDNDVADGNDPGDRILNESRHPAVSPGRLSTMAMGEESI